MDWFQQNATGVIAAGSAILAAVVAGGFALLGAWLNNRQNNQRLAYQIQHENSKENRKLFLQKGEELYVCLDKWQSIGFAQLLINEKIILDGLSSDGARAVLKDYSDTEVLSRIFTLLPIYFPELSDVRKECSRALINAANAKDKYEAGGVDKNHALKVVKENSDKFQSSFNVMLIKLQGVLLAKIKG